MIVIFWQTWEDPGVVDESTKCKGDNDPVDACDISTLVQRIISLSLAFNCGNENYNPASGLKQAL